MERWAEWLDHGWVSPNDVALGRYLYKWMSRDSDPNGELLASLTVVLSRLMSAGHVGLPLDGAWPADVIMLRGDFPDGDALAKAFTKCDWVADGFDSIATTSAPLWLSPNNYLYLLRVAKYEAAVAQWLSTHIQRSGSNDDGKNNRFAMDPQTTGELLGQLFPRAVNQASVEGIASIDWQRAAVALALRYPLVAITGGPGTGKTTTVVRLLAALQSAAIGGASIDDADSQEKPSQHLRMVVAAPTGKAAARLADSISRQIDQLPVSAEVKRHLPAATVTIHRLLEWSPAAHTFRRHAQRPLQADVVVVDEASMLDLRMMSALVAALKPSARLILLGDAQQLPAVGAGEAFNHVCEWGLQGLDDTRFEWLSATGSLPGGVSRDEVSAGVGAFAVRLLRSHRFKADSSLGMLADCVLNGDGQGGLNIGRAQGWLMPMQELLDYAWERWGAIAQQANVLDAMAMHQQFMILTATVYEVAAMNRALESHFNPSENLHYQGQPIMVKTNDYEKNIFNGDVGMVWPNDHGDLVAWFEIDNALVSIPLSALPDWDTCYAMTVHKSQGSEFAEVGVVLPEVINDSVNRQWLYTALTRAREKAYFLNNDAIFAQIVQGVSRRLSDFRAMLPSGAVS